jgi:hypothetical protein
MHRDAPPTRKPTEGTKEVHSPRKLFTEPRYVWLFQCSGRPVFHAATLDRRGRNLPKTICQNSSWTVSGQLIVGPGTSSSAGINLEALKAGIEKDGFYLWNADASPRPRLTTLGPKSSGVLCAKLN